jgi:hypothetical protein
MNFTEFYNSKNIDDIRGRTFDLVVCGGAPGRKWYANEHPDEDLISIRRLTEAVRRVRASWFVLVSTVDVYATPRWVDEEVWPMPEGLHTYGRNRLLLEACVLETFGDRATILRLPALFGPGLKKNALFDLMNGRDVDKIPSNAVYQWYPLSWLANSISWAMGVSCPVANLVSEPVEMEVIQQSFFPEARLGPACVDAASYSVESRYGRIRASFLLGEMVEFLRRVEYAR